MVAEVLLYLKNERIFKTLQNGGKKIAQEMNIV